MVAHELNKSLEKELTQAYVRTEHWISDFTFFEDEIRFLTNLMDRFITWAVVVDSQQMELLRQSAARLVKLDRERQSIAAAVKDNLSQVARLLKGEEAFDPELFRENFSDLESDQVNFLRQYRAVKKEIFGLSVRLKNVAG